MQDERLNQMRQTFFEEAGELLSELESVLLEMEDRPDDPELVGRAFRALHTIKGSAAMFGCEDVSRFTHRFEEVFDLVRNNEIPVTRELIDLSLLSRDQIRALVDAAQANAQPDEERSAHLLQELEKLVPSKAEGAEAVNQPRTKEEAGEEEETTTYRIRFRPNEDIFASGTNPLLILSELEELGRYSAVAHTDRIPPLEEIDPERCYVEWDIAVTTNQGKNAIQDAFIFVEMNADLKVEEVNADFDPESGYDPTRIGDILLARGDIRQEDINEVLKEKKRLGEELVSRGSVSQSRIQSALEEQKHLRESRKQKEDTEAVSSIRVAASKLDQLVNLIGELVIVQARISQTAADRDDLEFITMAEELERLTAELRDNSLGIRMVPIGSTFSRFRRLVRDLSSELGKKVLLTTEGAETELDKTMIDRLNDPMVHMIRNAIDHGVEMPDERAAAGKPEEGTVHLSAVHSGANVLITIRDDGKGLDPSVIRRKAVERGLISAEDPMNDQEVLNLVFAPGFSTAEKVTNLSGRGVGMDVVKRGIEALRGSVHIRSQKGKGTEVTIELPLTLAIIEGLQVGVGEDTYVMPLSIVEECIELSPEDIERAHGRHVIPVRGEILPYIRLREWFQIPGRPEGLENIVITHASDRRVGLVVDRVIGEHQTVIKTLGNLYKGIKGLSGATIQGNGNVALILDVPALVTSVEAEELRLTAG